MNPLQLLTAVKDLTRRFFVVEEKVSNLEAEVKSAMTETIAAWEIERIKREAEQEKAQLRRAIASSEANG